MGIIQQHPATCHRDFLSGNTSGIQPIRQPVRPYSERICQYDLIMAVPYFAQSQKLPAIRLHVHIGQFHQCAQRQVCLAPVFLYLFSIEADKPLKHPKIDGWENGSVLRQQSKQLVVHGPITVFDIIKQRQYKQGLLRSDIYLCRQFIQQAMPLGGIRFQQIQSALQVHIFSCRPPYLLEKCSPLIANKHIVRLDRTGIAQCQSQSAEHPDIIAQFFLKPLQHFAGITQIVRFKVAEYIRFRLPYLHRPHLSISPSRRIVLRSLDNQFSKCMVKIQINSPLICPVNRYPIDMH